MSLALRSNLSAPSLSFPVLPVPRFLPLQLLSPYHTPFHTPLLYLCLSRCSFLALLSLSPSHRIRSQAWRGGSERKREGESQRALYQQVCLMGLSAVSQAGSPWWQEVSLPCIAAFCATSCSLEHAFHRPDWSCAHNMCVCVCVQRVIKILLLFPFIPLPVKWGSAVKVVWIEIVSRIF